MNFIGKRMLELARERGGALCGFDAFNMESAQAVVSVAEGLSAPVFLQVGIESAKHMGLAMAYTVLHEAKKGASVDICVHLDHGLDVSDIEVLKKAMELGFESVMVDGSSLPLEENIALCRKVVELAHPRGICVEGELGRVSRDLTATRDELERLMTDPDSAARFVEQSGVDYLAVSVGSISGFSSERTGVQLDLDRLARIRARVAQPLVFHGGTGIPPDQLRAAVRLGVSKINIAHGFRKSFAEGMSAHLKANPEEMDPRKVLREARRSAEHFAGKKIEQITLLGN